jgi:spore coat protein U-like protein
MGLMLGGAAMATNLGVSANISNTCSIGTVTALAFGAYDPIAANAATDLHTQGSIALTCTLGDAAATVGLGLGGQPLSTQRYMSDGTATLAYNIYSTADFATVWDDSANKVTAPTGTGLPQTLTVYGSIPQAQNKPAGSYSDAVVIDVTP